MSINEVDCAYKFVILSQCEKRKGASDTPQTPDAKRIAHSFFSLPYHLTAAAAGWFFFCAEIGMGQRKRAKFT